MVSKIDFSIPEGELFAEDRKSNPLCSDKEAHLPKSARDVMNERTVSNEFDDQTHQLETIAEIASQTDNSEPKNSELQTNDITPSMKDEKQNNVNLTCNPLYNNEKRKSTATTNSSPLDPMYDPIRKAFLRPNVELPPIAITVPDEPRSFFDFESDSEEDTESIIKRASSVRVVKPRIIHQAKEHQTRAAQLQTVSFQKTDRPNSNTTSVNGNRSIVFGTPADALRALEGLPPRSKEGQSARNVQTLSHPPNGGNISIAHPSKLDSSIDGLRSNPSSATEAITLSRTISAPISSTYSRTRTMNSRPSNLIISPPSDWNKSFRETVVSTPYPSLKDESETPQSQTQTQKETDRFPSPERPELLLLELSVFGQPSSSVLLEIYLNDHQNFDDAELFQQLRSKYNNMLGLSRRLLTARSAFQATTNNTETPFDGPNFLQHLSKPSKGRNQKVWLLWLRNNQFTPKPSSRIGSVMSSTDSHGYSPFSFPRTPLLKHPSKQFPPTVLVHYRFDVLRISGGVLSTLLLSCLATVLWILFGYPGLKADRVEHGVDGVEVNWKRDAEMTILTGFVFGMLVLLLGCLIDLVWICISWILL